MSKIPYTKQALTYREQLDLLKERGMIVEDDNKALHLLENISYYRLSGYWYPMLKEPKHEHKFKDNSTFNTAFRLYCFDRELRKLVLRELEKIEVAIKAKMVYILSHKHNAFWYTDPNIFKRRDIHSKTVDKIRSEYNQSDEQFIMEFKQKYNNPLPPSWMMLELTSLGSLSFLYTFLNSTIEKREISNYFGLNDTIFASWLHSIVYVRNICAHHTRLWSRVLRVSPGIPRRPKSTFLNEVHFTQEDGSIASINNRVYYFLSMIIYLLNTINPNHSFKERLLELLDEFPMVDVRAMGFPENWKNEPLWRV